MKFQNIEDLKQAGFEGFVSVEDLRKDTSVIPLKMGVYMVVRATDYAPEFLAVGSGGFFKGKNPNIPIPQLESRWVKDTCVMYIGKAGGFDSSATLNSRLKQYIKFGMGQSVGHYGGRYIWQLKDSSKLLLCWKPLINAEPRQVECELLQEFKQQAGCRPFANIMD